MRCLYCGKELALFKRLRGGEFCSDAHRQRYQEEYTQLALNRLLQANSTQEKEGGAANSGGPNSKEKGTAEPESPALKRRERMGREEAPSASPAISTPLVSANNAKPVESGVLATPKQIDAPKRTAVLDPEPALIAARIESPAEETPRVEVNAPAGMSSFLLEFPVPSIVEAAAAVDSSTNMDSAPEPSLPRLNELPQQATDGRLDAAGRIELSLFTLADFQTPPHERGLELREFVRGVPHAEIRVRPATETGFDAVWDAVEVEFAAVPPQESPTLWHVSEEELPVLGVDPEILLGDLARLDFGVTGWNEAGSAAAASEESPSPVNDDPEPPLSNDAAAADSPEATLPNDGASDSPEASLLDNGEDNRADNGAGDGADDGANDGANDGPEAIESAGPEPMRVEPIHIDPAPHESTRPQPLHFEPVHIDPVFMERIAATAEFNAQQTAQAQVSPANDRETSETMEAEPEVEAAPEPAATEPPVPPAITKPALVTLHGLAPVRGKPVQAFTSAVFRSSDIQIPRETCLPLRPTMVFGPAPKGTAAPAAAPATVEEKAAPSKPVKSIPVPEKRESRPVEMKPSRSEVRILPVRVKEESPARQKEPGRPAEPAKPAPAKESATAAVKETSSATAKETPVEKPKASTPPVVIRPPAPGEAKNRGASPAKESAKEPARAAEPARPAEEPDLLGLPKLSFQPSENFWTRLPVAVRIGAVAGCLAVVIGGIMLTSRGSGSAKATPAVDQETQVVEAGSALANTAGWAQDWFADRTGAKQGRHVDVLRGSLSMRDYRMRFEGQIEQGALGWVFRANGKSFYVEKIQVVTPGREPVVALVRFAVIDGQEQQRTQIPLAIKAHLDTMYKVRMDVVGSRFTTWVQDEKVDQWTDTQIGAGGVGLYYDSGDSAKLRDTLNVIPLVQR